MNQLALSPAVRAATLGALLFLFTVTALGASGLVERDSAISIQEIDLASVAEGGEITVTGIVGVYGNEPHTYLALAVSQPDSAEGPGQRLVRVEGEHHKTLYALQNRTVTITGVVTSLEIAPGFPMVVDVETWEVVEEP